MATRTAERTEFLTDVLITAIENGGYGFFTVEEYDPDNGIATVEDKYDDDHPQYRVSPEIIARGIGVIRSAEVGTDGDLVHGVNGKRLYMSPGMRKSIMRADRENDAGNLDVVDALAILECGLFGQVVYA